MKATSPIDAAPRVRLWWLERDPATDSLQALARVLAADRPTSAVRLGRTPAGQPILEDPPGHVAVSHTGTTLVLAHAATRVGVDVERRRRERPWVALAERYFSTNEAGQVAAATDPGAAFLRLWVVKEAALKAMGLGIAGALAGVETSSAAPDATAMAFRRLPRGHDPVRFRAWSGEHRGHFLGIVLECTVEASWWIIDHTAPREHRHDR